MNGMIRVRPGLLKRMREIHRLVSEEAQASRMGVSLSTIRRIDNGTQPSGDFMVAMCETFGLNIGEAFEITPRKTPGSQSPGPFHPSPRPLSGGKPPG